MFAGRKKAKAAKEVPAWKLQLEAAEAAPPPADGSTELPAVASSSDVGRLDGSSAGVKRQRDGDDDEAGKAQDEIPLRDDACADELNESKLHEHSSSSRSASPTASEPAADDGPDADDGRAESFTAESFTAESLTAESFTAARRFEGARRGCVFKLGPRGLGYYSDPGSHAAASRAERECFESELEGELEDADGGAAAASAVAGDSVDAPIVAALASHRRALREVQEQAELLLEDTKRWGKQRGLVHSAEVLEVGLTDQLLQLQAMLDDCATGEGRASVKAVCSQLRELGASLLTLTKR